VLPVNSYHLLFDFRRIDNKIPSSDQSSNEENPINIATRKTGLLCRRTIAPEYNSSVSRAEAPSRRLKAEGLKELIGSSYGPKKKTRKQKLHRSFQVPPTTTLLRFAPTFEPRNDRHDTFGFDRLSSDVLTRKQPQHLPRALICF